MFRACFRWIRLPGCISRIRVSRDLPVIQTVWFCIGQIGLETTTQNRSLIGYPLRPHVSSLYLSYLGLLECLLAKVRCQEFRRKSGAGSTACAVCPEILFGRASVMNEATDAVLHLNQFRRVINLCVRTLP